MHRFKETKAVKQQSAKRASQVVKHYHRQSAVLPELSSNGFNSNNDLSSIRSGEDDFTNHRTFYEVDETPNAQNQRRTLNSKRKISKPILSNRKASQINN